MASKIKVDTLETADGTGSIALSNQLSGMTVASLPTTGTLPALSGANLTALTSANLTGALPAIDGASLTNMAAGGKVLQVIQVRNGTRSWVYNMANGDVVAGAVVITPSSTSSKILLFMSHTGERVNSGGAGNINSTGTYSTNWYVNASSLSGGQIEQTTGYSYPNNARYNVSGHYLHLPNSTSAQSYDVRITGGGSLTSSYFLFYNITITAIEVGA